MIRHLILVLIRLLLACGVFLALPFSFMQWGETAAGVDGQQELGFVITFAVIGAAAAVVFVVVGSVAQWLLRTRPPRAPVFFDLGLFLVFAAALAYGGMTAEVESRPQSGMEVPHAEASLGSASCSRTTWWRTVRSGSRPARRTAAARSAGCPRRP